MEFSRQEYWMQADSLLPEPPRKPLTHLNDFKLAAAFYNRNFSGGLEGTESACNAGDLGLIPDLGRSPGEGNGNPLQYSCLENTMDGGAW